jgi:c-di-GMP-binding flagellar brake protein YcgR
MTKLDTDELTQNAQKDHVTLGVEWGMSLAITLKGHSESHKATLVGMERGSYLICNAPSSRGKGIWTMMHKENFIIVRYIHNGIVYGFHCTLIAALEFPFNLLILSYPEHIETVNLRQHGRIPCLIPATIKVHDHTYKGATIDVSTGGSCFVFHLSDSDESAQVQRGDEADLSIQIPGSQNEVTIKMDIVAIRTDSTKVTLGTRFKNLAPDTLNSIQNYQATAALNV